MTTLSVLPTADVRIFRKASSLSSSAAAAGVLFFDVGVFESVGGVQVAGDFSDGQRDVGSAAGLRRFGPETLLEMRRLPQRNRRRR
jgi:hypothetical protein